MLTVSRMRLATPTFIRGAAYISNSRDFAYQAGSPAYQRATLKAGCGLGTRLGRGYVIRYMTLWFDFFKKATPLVDSITWIRASPQPADRPCARMHAKYAYM